MPKVKGKWKEGCTYFLNFQKSSVMVTNGWLYILYLHADQKLQEEPLGKNSQASC